MNTNEINAAIQVFREQEMRKIDARRDAWAAAEMLCLDQRAAAYAASLGRPDDAAPD